MHRETSRREYRSMPPRSEGSFLGMSESESEDPAQVAYVAARRHRIRLVSSGVFLGVLALVGLVHVLPSSSAHGKSLVAGTLSEKSLNTNPCVPYNGLYVEVKAYAQAQHVFGYCCNPQCGQYCGAMNCQSHPTLDWHQCCHHGINNTCGQNRQAPCSLPVPANLALNAKCANLGGILHPLKQKCCASQCGRYCGHHDCQKGPGGYRDCCGTLVTNSCNATNPTAPCMLQWPASGPPVAACIIKKMFTGIMGVGVSDVNAFVQNQFARQAAQDAMATVLSVPVSAVTITGISETIVRRLSSDRRLGLSVTVGYSIEVDQSNPLAADKISQETGPLKIALQQKLTASHVAVTVISLSMPPPATQVGCVSSTTMPVPTIVAPVVVPVVTTTIIEEPGSTTT